MWFFGVFGFLLKKFHFEPAPLVLALVLGPMLEDNLRQALIISGGTFFDLHQPPFVRRLSRRLRIRSPLPSSQIASATAGDHGVIFFYGKEKKRRRLER